MDWLRDKILGLFSSKYSAAAVRHVLSAVGGALTALGFLTPEQIQAILQSLDPLVSGLVGLAVAFLLSFLSKAKQ